MNCLQIICVSVSLGGVRKKLTNEILRIACQYRDLCTTSGGGNGLWSHAELPLSTCPFDTRVVDLPRLRCHLNKCSEHPK